MSDALCLNAVLVPLPGRCPSPVSSHHPQAQPEVTVIPFQQQTLLAKLFFAAVRDGRKKNHFRKLKSESPYSVLKSEQDNSYSQSFSVAGIIQPGSSSQGWPHLSGCYHQALPSTKGFKHFLCLCHNFFLIIFSNCGFRIPMIF